MSYFPTIAVFWVEPCLSWVEQLGLLSFVQHSDIFILGFNWAWVYKKRAELLDNPPADSYIASLAKELEVVIDDAPILETRQKNREYIAEQNNDSELLQGIIF